MIKEILYKNIIKGVGYTTGTLLTLGVAYIVTLGIEHGFFKMSNISFILKKQEQQERFSDCINNETSKFSTLEVTSEQTVAQSKQKNYKKLFNF